MNMKKRFTRREVIRLTAIGGGAAVLAACAPAALVSEAPAVVAATEAPVATKAPVALVAAATGDKWLPLTKRYIVGNRVNPLYAMPIKPWSSARQCWMASNNANPLIYRKRSVDLY